MQPKSSETQSGKNTLLIYNYSTILWQSGAHCDKASLMGLVERQLLSQKNMFEIRGTFNEINVDRGTSYCGGRQANQWPSLLFSPLKNSTTPSSQPNC